MTGEVAPILDGWRRGELRVQRCATCDAHQFPPRAVCLACRSTDLDWAIAEPRGEIHSFTVVHRAPTERFKARVPYAIALVDVAPGVRMMMNVAGSDFDGLRIGTPVAIGFEASPEDLQPRPVARV